MGSWWSRPSTLSSCLAGFEINDHVKVHRGLQKKETTTKKETKKKEKKEN